MTFQPVLPPLLLAAVAAIILVARIATLRRLTSAARTRGILWRWAGLTLAALLLVASAARPVLGPLGSPTPASRIRRRPTSSSSSTGPPT